MSEQLLTDALWEKLEPGWILRDVYDGGDWYVLERSDEVFDGAFQYLMEGTP